MLKLVGPDGYGLKQPAHVITGTWNAQKLVLLSSYMQYIDCDIAHVVYIRENLCDGQCVLSVAVVGTSEASVGTSY